MTNANDKSLNESIFWKAIFDRTRDCILIVNVQTGKIVKANRQSEKLLDRTQKKIIGTPFTSLLPPPEASIHNDQDGMVRPPPVAQNLFREAITECVTTGEVQEIEHEIGKRKWVRSRILPLEAKGKINHLMIILTDTTTRKWAEDALQESEQNFRNLVEATSDFIWEINKEGIYTYVSPKVFDILGYKPEEVRGKTPFDLMPPGEAKRVSKIFQDVVARQGTFNSLENVNRHKDGHLVILETSGVPIFDAERRLLGYNGIDRDVTARKKAEEALKASEEKYRKFYMKTPAMFESLDKEGVIVSVNDTWLEKMGYTREEVIGHRYTKFLTPASKQYALSKAAPEFLKTGHLQETYYQLLKKNGELMDTLISGASEYDESGKFVGILNYITDITTRKRAEKALQESEQRYRNLVEATSDIIWDVNNAGVYTYASPKVFDILGYTQGEVRGKTLFDLMPPGEAERVTKIFQDVVSRQGTIYSLENVNLHKDGHRVVLQTSGVPIFDAEGKVVGYRGIALDVTERKKAEEALKASEEKFRRLYMKTPAMLESVDRSGKIVSVNDTWLEKMGYSREEVISHSYLKFLTPASRDYALSKAVPEFLKTGEYNDISYQLVKKNGETLDTLITAIVEREKSGRIIGYIEFINDITTRKQAEIALQESEQRYRNLVETMSDIIWEVNNEGKYTYVSPKVFDILGYTPEEVLGKNVVDYRPAGETGHVAETFQNLLTREEPINSLVTINLHKDGHPVVIETSSVPFYDAERKLLGYRGIGRDVSARKKVEDALKASEEKYRTLYMKTPAMLESLDSHGRILDVNDTWLKKTGYTREEVLGHRYPDFLTPASRDYEHMKTLPVFLRTGEYLDIPLEIVKRNGELMDTLTTAISERDESGKIIRTLAIITDVTARKRSEEALRKSEEKYRTLFESNIVGVFLSDREGHVHECNQAIAVIFGYTREEFLHIPTPTLYVNRKDRDYLLSMLDKNGEVENFETAMKKKDGTHFWVLCSAKRISLEDLDHFLVTLIDINQIKQAMQVLKDSQESTLKLYEDALSISDMKTNLITFASHELKTPLVPIIGWVDFMLHALQKGKKLDELIGIDEITSILQSARRLTTIINNFLDVGRLESKRLELKVEKHKTTILMKNTLESVTQLALSRNITINNNIQDLDLWVDGFRIEQIFVNILSNAIKYSPEGTQIWVTSEVNGDLVSIFFKDQGAGFTPEQLKSVWRPFSSKDRQSKHDILPGTGIGLFLTKGLIERHHGTIEISSPGPNLGSTVKVTLPMKQLRSSESQS